MEIKLREGGRKEGREGGREGGRARTEVELTEHGHAGVVIPEGHELLKEGGREGGMEGGREGGREGTYRNRAD